MGIKISDMTPVAEVTGPELLPASVGGAPRSISSEQIKNYLVAHFEAITSGVSGSGALDVYVKQGGSIKRLDIDLIAQRIADDVFGKAAETSPSGANIIPIKAGGVEKTLSLSVLSEFVRSSISSAVMNISALNEALPLGDEDVLAVGQDETRKVKLEDLSDEIADRTIEAIEKIDEGSEVSIGDGVYINRAGSLVPVDVAKVAQLTVDEMWGKDHETTLTDATQVPVLIAGEEKVTELQDLAAYMQISVATQILDISGLNSAVSLQNADLLLVSQTGTSRKVTLGNIAQKVMDEIWGKAAEDSPADAHVVPLKAGGTEKKVTLEVLANYIEGKIAALALDVGNLTEAVNLTASNLLIVSQEGNTRRTTLGAINAAIYAGFASAVEGMTDTALGNDSDALYIVRNGVGRKITLGVLKSSLGIGSFVSGPESVVPDRIPQWQGTRTLKGGLSVQSAVREAGIASISAVPTEQAVRSAINSHTPPVRETVREEGQTDSSLVSETGIRAAIDAGGGAGGGGVQLGETDETAHRGDHGVIAYNHSQSPHAPVNAQKNSDITKQEIEDKLTGTISSHTHAGMSSYLGIFQTDAALRADYPAAVSGNYALVLSTGTIWYWDQVNVEWSNSGDPPTALELGTSETTAHRGDHGHAAYLHSQEPHLELGETDETAYRGDRGVIAYDHSQSAHAPVNAQKNSDITKGEIEAVLTGEITSHTHPEMGGGGGGDPETWSEFPATHNVDLDGNEIEGASAITLGGQRRTSWPSLDNFVISPYIRVTEKHPLPNSAGSTNGTVTIGEQDGRVVEVFQDSFNLTLDFDLSEIDNLGLTRFLVILNRTSGNLSVASAKVDTASWSLIDTGSDEDVLHLFFTRIKGGLFKAQRVFV